MISPVLIILSAFVTGVVLLIAGQVAGWRAHQSGVAALLSAAFVILWRLSSNALHLNDDIVPAVSRGDLGCLVAGALGPAIVSLRGLSRRGVLIALGAMTAFLVNVVIL